MRSYILICIALLGITNLSYSQNLDSLVAKVQLMRPACAQSCLGDSIKLKLLVQLSEECDEKDISKYAEPAIELADKILKNVPSNFKSQILNQKAKALNNMGFKYHTEGEFEKAIQFYEAGLKIYEETKDKLGIATALNNAGLSYYNQGNAHEALNYYAKSLKLKAEIGDKKGAAQTLNNTAQIYQSQGNIPLAIDHYERGLKIQEEIGDKENAATTLNNIGSIYQEQGDWDNALITYTKSLKLQESIGDKYKMATSLSNIGTIYRNKHNFKMALEYWNQSLKIREKIGDKKGIAIVFYNTGGICNEEGNIDEALAYFKKSLNIRTEIGDKKGIAYCYVSIASIYWKQKKNALALSYSDSSLLFSKRLGYPKVIEGAEIMRSRIDSATGNYAGAFAHYKQYIIFNDSVSNEENKKASIRNQLKYEFEKKEAIINEQQEKEHAVAEEKSRFQQIVIGTVIIGLLFVLVFAAFVWNSLKTTRKQKIIIEEKQREILDSIHYAKRIQTALITNEKYIEKSLNKLQKNG